MSHFLIATFLGILAIGNHPSDGGQVISTEFQPEFAEALENLTVPVGRDATFTCVVRGLGGYRVGWVRADSKAIQAIYTHVITHNPRVSVSHSDHSMWNLHIKGVKEEDRGSYMCQVNTDPMISQVAFLEVVIPPDFIMEETSGDVMAPEGSTVKLHCNARGHPKPSILWKREEDGQNITLKTSAGSKTQVSVFEGNVLRLMKISRADMGIYLCIASNGVPPSIVKRTLVSVHFHPVIHVPNQLVGAPINTDVTLECNVEAYPKSIHFWMKDNGGMIITGDRYEVLEITKSMFEVKMSLIIKKFRRADAGEYHCVAKNSLGDVDSKVKLHVLKMGLGESPEGAVKIKYDTSFTGSDEDEGYYEGSDLSLNPIDDSSLDQGKTPSIIGGVGNQGKGSESGGISNNYTPGGDPQNTNNNNNNRVNNNNNNNNGRHSRKSYGGSGANNNLGNNKNHENSNPNNIPFQKTVVVSLSPNSIPSESPSSVYITSLNIICILFFVLIL